MTRDEEITEKYVSGLSAVEISATCNVTPRQVQRIVKKAGKSRTQSESYILAIKRGRMVYYRKPEHLKRKRKTLSLKLRYAILERDNRTCQSCGGTVVDGLRIEIDHIDDDATNNDPSNLQVLCNHCNQGKSRTGPS